MLIIDFEPKRLIVEEYINAYKERDVTISKSVEHYVDLIDDLGKNNPDLFSNSFKDLLKIAAVMEYDFDNGQDKDKLAEHVLGPTLYEANKKRLGR